MTLLPSLPHASVAHVLCDPWLLRRITDFQAGLPLALCDFWAQHDPSVPRPTTSPFVAANIDTLQRLVATEGSEKTLQLLTRVWYRDNRFGSSLRRPLFRHCVRVAIETNRHEMVQWALDNATVTRDWLYRADEWWCDAIKSYRAQDFAVLDLLRLHRPIDDAQFQRSCVYALIEHAELELLKWVNEARPGILVSEAKQFTTMTVARGDLDAVRYVCEHISSDGISWQAFKSAYETKRLDILEYLIQLRPDRIDDSEEILQVQRRLVEDTHPNVQQFVEKHVHLFRRGLSRRVELAVEKNDLHQLEEWLESGFLAHVAPVSIRGGVTPNMFPSIQFLHEKGFAAVTTDAMDQAALERAWDVVDWLHEHRFGGCTWYALQSVVGDGNLERVRFFFEHYHVVCPAWLTAEAAREQPLDFVRCLLEEAGAECTPDVMNDAAASGRLHVVQYLHATRTEGCTTDAIDHAAENGHLPVVEYLLLYRSEGFTSRGIEDALENGHLAIVHRLYRHSPDLFTADLLHNLLLRGAFDIYMTLRDAYPDQADRVLDRVMFVAGKEMEMPTIRFILNVLGRTDLAHRAVDGCVHVPSPAWLYAVLTVTGPDSCHLSAVRLAASLYASNRIADRWDFIGLVIQACNDPRALETAIAAVKETDDRPNLSELERLKQRFTTGVPSLSLSVESVNPLLLDPRTRAWAIEIIVRDEYDRFDNRLGIRKPRNWTTRAVHMRDLPLLQALHDLPATAIDAYLHATTGEETTRRGSVKNPFIFDGARAAAIQCGSLELLQWLVATIDLPIESTLLSEAVYYHQYDMAEWLVANHPSACRHLDWTKKKAVGYYQDVGLRGGLLDWLETHDAVRNVLPFAGIVAFAARHHDVESLVRLYDWDPALVASRPEWRAMLHRDT